MSPLRIVSCCVAVAVALFSVLPLRGEDKPAPKPRVTALAPLAVQQGFTGTVRLRGFKMKDATAVRAEGPAQPGKIEIKERKDAGTPVGMEKGPLGESEVVIELTLASDFPAGPMPLVVVVGDRPTAPVALQVLPAAQLTDEKEPNNGFRAAMKIEAGRTMTGLINSPRDVDVFEVAATAGKALRVSVTASSVASLLDPLLTAYDAQGRRLAAQDDAAKGTLDATLEVTPAADGPVFLVVQDALDFGSEWHAYRLEVAMGP